MHVGLFVPCYIDQLYPDVAIATLELLEANGCTVGFPDAQTCCGQPMANTGCADTAEPMARRFVAMFAPYDYVVCPSGSCTSMVVHHYQDFGYFQGADNDAYQAVKQKTYELSQFLVDVCQATTFPDRFPHRVGLHQSCHGLRELRLGPCSEARTERREYARELLSAVPDLQWTRPQRSDECCGFGGTFAVAESDVSGAMGRAKLADFQQADAEVIVAGDMSCLMHLQGLIGRDGSPLHVMHLAQVLRGRPITINSNEALQR